MLDVADAGALASLRDSVDLQTLRLGDRLWLWARSPSDELDAALRLVPGAERFSVQADRQLVAIGRRVPSGHLPDGEWLPLRQVVELALPPPALPARLADRVELRLVRASLAPAEEEVPPSGMLLTGPAWLAYAEMAPEARLSRLSFAASARGEAFVIGKPLPQLAGRQFYSRQGIWMPVGWRWQPAVEPAVARRVLGLSDMSDLVLWREDGRWSRLSQHEFARATRAAVRATFGGATFESG